MFSLGLTLFLEPIFFMKIQRRLFLVVRKRFVKWAAFRLSEEIFRSQVFFPCHFSRKPRCRCRASLIMPARTQTYATRPGYLPTEQYCNLSQPKKCRLKVTSNQRCSFHRRCTVCRKKRSLRTNSFFEKYPKVPLGDLILLIYFWSQDEQRRRAARMLSLNENLVCRVFRSLEDICSADIEWSPFIPFPGTAVVKCDESKFSHKAKVGYSVFDCWNKLFVAAL